MPRNNEHREWVSNVPPFLEQETLYSRLVVLFRLNGHTNYHAFIRTAFGGNRSSPHALIPTFLRELRGVDSRWTPERVVQDFTVLPYFQPFFKPVYAERIRRMIAANEASVIPTYGLGLLASKIKPERVMRYCVECLCLQLEKYSRGAWLRPHQLPLVRCCWLHATPLQSNALDNSKGMLPEDFACKPISPRIVDSDLWLAKSSAVLLRMPFESARLSWARFYRTHAEALDCGPANHLNLGSIAGLIIKRFPSDFLKRISALSWQSGEASLWWLQKILARSEKFVHPICHMLLMEALFGSVSDALRTLETTDESELSSLERQTVPSDPAITKTAKRLTPYRLQLTNFLLKHPAANRAAFRKQFPVEYTFLWKNDPKWLDAAFEGTGVRRWRDCGSYRRRVSS